MMTGKITGVLEAIKVPPTPFPGLRPFEFSESHLFFGRDGQTEKMLDRLADTRFLAVIGTSGSGKSSLVRAGMMPALRAGMMPGAGSNWRIAVMRPSNDPIGNLARALNAPDVFGSDDTENAAIQVAVAEATLRLGSRGLIETVRQNAMTDGENLLVIVDQFEELFRFAREARKTKDERFDNDAAAFVKLLLEAVKPNESGQREANIYVVLTMRSDFLGDCSQFWDLPEAINESQYLIPRLTRDQLREVIIGPVALCGGEISPRLVNQLLNDISDDRDQLPILQHALMRTWDEWKRPERERHSSSGAHGAIDLCCYEAIGGMANALSKHANEAFDELPDDRHRRIAEKLFRSLTEKEEDNREIRRPVTLGELCAVAEAEEDEVKTVIETFRLPGRSFLMPPVGTPLHSETLIDISHESMIRAWDRLQHWVKEEAKSAAIYLRLVGTDSLHKEGKSELWHGADLQTGLEWKKKNNPTAAWARRYNSDFEAAIAFLLASEQKRAEKQAEVERRQQEEAERTRRELAQALALAAAEKQAAEAEKRRADDQTKASARLRRALAALVVITLLAVTAAMFAWRSSVDAKKQRKYAEDSAKSAENSAKKEKEAKDEAVRLRTIADDNYSKAEIARITADKNRKIAEDSAKKEKEAKDRAEALAKSEEKAKNDAQKALTELEKQRKAAVVLAEKEKTAKEEARALAKSEKEAKEEAKRLFRSENLRSRSVEASRLLDENPILAATLAASSILAFREIGEPSPGNASQMKSNVLNPALQAIQQSLKRTLLSKIILDGESVKGALIAEDGKLVTVNSKWEVRRWKEIPPKSGDGAISNFPKADEQFLLKPGVDAQLRSLAISPDGKYLAMGQDDGKLKLGDVDKLRSGSPGEILRIYQHTIGRIAFSSPVSNDEYYLASSSVSWSSSTSHTKESKSDKKWKKPGLPARIADLITGTKKVKLVTAITFSPDKGLVAMGREDGVVEIRDTKNGKLKFNWPAHEGQVFGLVFSPSNDQLVTVSEDKTAKLWCIAPSNSCKELSVKPAAPGFLEIRSMLTHNLPANPKEEFNKGAHSVAISGAALSSDGKLLVTVGHDGAIAIWDFDKLKTGPLVIIQQAHKGRVTGVSFKASANSQGKYQLVTFSADDKTTRLWELPDVGRLREINELITELRDMELDQKEATNEELQRVVMKAMSLLPFLIPLKKLPDSIKGLFSEKDYGEFLQLLSDSTYVVVRPRALWFPNPQKQARLE